MPETTYIPLDGSGSRGSCLGNLSGLEKILILLSATLGIFVIGLTIGLVNCNNSHNDNGNVTTIAPEPTTTASPTPAPSSSTSEEPTSASPTPSASTTPAPSSSSSEEPPSTSPTPPSSTTPAHSSTSEASSSASSTVPTQATTSEDSAEYFAPKMVEIPTSSPAEELNSAENLSKTTFLDKDIPATDSKTIHDNFTTDPRESQTEA